MQKVIMYLSFVLVFTIELSCYADNIEDLQELSDRGDAKGLYELGVLYNIGVGVQKNKSKAESYFLKASEKGHPGAQYQLGLILKEKGNIDAAVYWLEKAANNKDIKAQYLLGSIYEKGEIADLDYSKAIHFYNMAITQKDPFSQYALGAMYASGVGVEKNLEKAFSLYIKAANQDYVLAQFSLGLFFLHGKGTERSIVDAYKWFAIAVKRWRHANAATELSKIENEMSIEQLKEAKKLVKNWLENLEGKNPLGSPFVEE
jgi:uncharacterized protein